MHIYRKIEEKLKEWKNSNYGLIVYGARQVGKTYIINNFIDNNFESVFYINLYHNVNAIKTIIKSQNVDDFLLRLSFLSKKEIKKDTCIFIDEIQEYYTYIIKNKIDDYFDPITNVKFIVERNKNRIVLSGSLLRMEMDNIISNPTGYLLPLEMYPLDFEEFLLAMSIKQEFIDIAKNSFENNKQIPDYIHNEFMNLFRKYLLIGGMPKAVSEFIDKNSIIPVTNAHKTIEHFIKDDIVKYTDDNEKLKVKEIYDLIPTELDKISKRFFLSDIPGHNKNNDEHLSFSWLNAAGVTIPVYSVTNPIVPLKASSNRKQFKLFLEDVGIFTYLLFDHNEKQKLLNGELNSNFGAICESFVAQELHAHGFKNLYYYNSKKNGEIDFLIEKRGKIIPLEIKSGKDYTKHSALNNLLNNKSYHINSGLVFNNNNFEKKENIYYYPIYCIDFINY